MSDDLVELSEELLDDVVAGMGGSRRDGQVRMVEAVAQSLHNDGHLLVQAGTGTGKSLGYLIPAACWALTEGKRVVVSTATIALQRQIIHADAPRVASAIRDRMGLELKVALLKGWNNYVCLRKAEGGYPEEDALLSRAAGEFGASATGEEVVRLREWSATTDSGDRDDLAPGVSDRAWRQVSITKPECLGTKCPVRDACFAVLARREAEEADVVVTNHSMLGIQSAGTPVLPDTDAFIVDEAHDLADRVTSQLTSALSRGDLAALARTLRRVRIVGTGLESAADGLADALDATPVGRLTQLPADVTDALLRVLGELQQAEEDAKDLPAKQEAELAEKNVVRSRIQSSAETIERLLSDRVAEGQLVPWVGRDTEGRSSIYVAPLDISASLADRLFEGKPAVLTSATLTIGGSFTPMAASVGFTYPSQGPWEGIDVGSPFDHAKQAILYVAAHLPVPQRDGYGSQTLDELLELIEASRGGALGLFTSRRAAEEAAEYVRARTELPILLQGEDQLPNLVGQFADDDGASLFGTLSLWQGVDVPGQTCRLVVIDRIPFPRPNEPLTEARDRAVKARGGNGFMEVSATQAALRLAQGAGRLVRTHHDRGVVAVLDPRLRTARYAEFLLASLPPMWRTTDGEQVRGALARLADGGSSAEA